jgi:hypothetical protein
MVPEELSATRPEVHPINKFHVALFGIAGHDLRQPLQVIQNSYDLLRTRSIGPRERALLDKGELALSRLGEQFDRMLDALRFYEQTKTVDISSVPLAPLLWRLANENEEAALRRGTLVQRLVSFDRDVLAAAKAQINRFGMPTVAELRWPVAVATSRWRHSMMTRRLSLIVPSLSDTDSVTAAAPCAQFANFCAQSITNRSHPAMRYAQTPARAATHDRHSSLIERASFCLAAEVTQGG